MTRCWTCGTSVTGYSYECSSCEDVVRELENLDVTISGGLDELARIQEEGFNKLSSQLSEVATILEWGFGEISWRLRQQTDILRSIDHTLKTPSETKANEWRKMAEELRRRGVLDESEEFYLKALESNRLDYRIYVGLAETYLQSNKFDKAKIFLEKSLPHAPRENISERARGLLRQGEKITAIKEYRAETGVGLAEAKDAIDRIAAGQDFDWRSHSYRLIGHIYMCEENYNQAVAMLRSAIDLSPGYEDGHYDYAQYSAQIRNTESCLSSLQKAILAKPLYFYLPQKERNFDPLRSEVQKLLTRISTEAFRRAEDAISKSESTLKEVDESVSKALKEAEEAVSKARQALKTSRDKAGLNSSTIYESAKRKHKLAYDNAKSTLEPAKDKVASGDYVAFLEAKPIAEKSLDLAIRARDEVHSEAKRATDEAHSEREHYERRRAEKVKNAWKMVPVAIGVLLLSPFIAAIGGCTINMFLAAFKLSSQTLDTVFAGCIYGGLIIGFITGICLIIGALK